MNSNTLSLEDLSSLIDAELAADRRRFLLKRLETDADLAACWERYHLAGDCLRRRPIALAGREFGAKVTAAIAEEPTPRAVTGSPLRGWAGGLALAASVTLATLLVFTLPESGRDSSGQPVVAQAGSGAGEVEVTITEAEFEAYLIRHNNALRERGLEGFVPFVDLVTSAGAESAVQRARNGVTELR